MHPPKQPNIPPQPTEPQGDDVAGTRVIPVIQEEASISRVAEKTGNAVRVRIATHEETRQIPVSEIIEELSVEHVPINRYVDERSAPREEGDVVIIPVFETVPVVVERLLLKEEIRIVRHRREVQRTEEVVLRRETPVVERRASGQEEWSPDSPDS